MGNFSICRITFGNMYFGTLSRRRKIYKTGDIAKYNERGEIIFLARKDHQIKHMGHRIDTSRYSPPENSIRKIFPCSKMPFQSSGCKKQNGCFWRQKTQGREAGKSFSAEKTSRSGCRRFCWRVLSRIPRTFSNRTTCGFKRVKN